MRASTVSRPVRHHVRETGAWVLRVSALAVASVLGWFTIYVSVTQLSAVPSDGSDSAILNLPYLLPVGLVIAALCLPTVRSLPVLLGSLRTSTVAWLISTASGVIAYLPVLINGLYRNDLKDGALPIGLVALGLAGVLLATLSAGLLPRSYRIRGWALSRSAVAGLWAVIAIIAGSRD